MPELVRSSTSFSLGFKRQMGPLAEVDRQSAWELYCEMISTLAVHGQVDDRGEHHFKSEVLSDSFDQLEAFYSKARDIMASYPAGQVETGRGAEVHLGSFISLMLELVIQPMLLKWKAEYLYWWDVNKTNGSPFVVQFNYTQLDEMLEDWTALRRFCRDTMGELARTYDFIAIPDELRSWT